MIRDSVKKIYRFIKNSERDIYVKDILNRLEWNNIDGRGYSIHIVSGRNEDFYPTRIKISKRNASAHILLNKTESSFLYKICSEKFTNIVIKEQNDAETRFAKIVDEIL